MNKLSIKKLDKETRLLDAALELFLENGISNITIDQICKKANVAKGTFYLYFKDKDDLEVALIDRESKIVIVKLFSKTFTQDLSFEDKVLYFTNEAIDYFIANKTLLELFKRNFHLPIKGSDINNSDNIVIKDVVEHFIIDSNLDEKYDKNTIYKLIYIVIEMISSVTYSSICLNMPGPIEEIKPMILQISKHIFDAI